MEGPPPAPAMTHAGSGFCPSVPTAPGTDTWLRPRLAGGQTAAASGAGLILTQASQLGPGGRRCGQAFGVLQALASAVQGRFPTGTSIPSARGWILPLRLGCLEHAPPQPRPGCKKPARAVSGLLWSTSWRPAQKLTTPNWSGQTHIGCRNSPAGDHRDCSCLMPESL